MKKILVFLDSFNVGGVTNVAMGIYNNLDKTKYQMDFVRDGVYAENDCDRLVKANGNKVYLFNKPAIGKIPVLNYKIQREKTVKSLLSQIKKCEYDVIHIHAHAYIALYLAKKLQIPVKITHFHESVTDFGDNVEKSFITRKIWKTRQKIYNCESTVKAGDSLTACKVKFGKKADEKEFSVFNPPIDFNKFNPKNYDKELVFDKYGIDKRAFNIIHVGRLSLVKNQKFMIDILSEANKEKDTRLYIVGEGDYKKELIKYAEEKSVFDKLNFLPANTSPDIYLCMNCSLLTSFSEAFGMVAVESQLMGVRCFASTFVPNDVDVGGCVFLDLTLGEKTWSEIILNSEREFDLEKDKLELFKIENLVKRLEKIYDK